MPRDLVSELGAGYSDSRLRAGFNLEAAVEDDAAELIDSPSFSRENKKREWLKPRKKKLRKPHLLAEGTKHCTSCGTEMKPAEGALATTWGKIRQCDKCQQNPVKLKTRGGKYCMYCGTFFSLADLLKRGVDKFKGLNTWAHCGCKKK